MWRNFRNVGNAMQALGNVVAPPVEDDEESYYEDEEEELEEADDIDSQENDDQWIQNHGAADQPEHASPLKSGFGFVGMIARALDRSQDEDDDGSYEEDDDDGEEVVELYHDESPSETQQLPLTEEVLDTKGLTPPPPSPPQGTTTPPEQWEDDGWDDIHTTWANHDSTAQAEMGPVHGATIEHRPHIQRETGSVSPISPSRKSLQSSPVNAASTISGSPAAAIVDNLQSKLPDLLDEPHARVLLEKWAEERAETPQEVADIERAPTELKTDTEIERIEKEEMTPIEKSNDQPETEAPGIESPGAPTISNGSPNASSQRSGSYGQQRRGSYKIESDEKPQRRRSSKVSLSDARFLAEPPRPEELETADRWDALKSTSLRQKGRNSSKDNHVPSSRHSLDSYFDDSSLSSVSSHNRLGARKDHAQSTTTASVKPDHNMHLSASSPALPVGSSPTTPKDNKHKVSATGAEDRFRAEPLRLPADDLPARDLRFASTKSHVAPPPEPQRQASCRQWSHGSSKNKAESMKANIIEAGRNKADFDSVVTEGTGSVDPPRNPRRKYSGDESPSIPEEERKKGRRPPLVTGNSKDGDVLPRRPVQRMHSLTEEYTNHDDSETPVSTLETTNAPNGVNPNAPRLEDTFQFDELSKRCLELEKQLKQASEARELYEQKWKQEETNRETQLVSFREKEARLLDAAEEERERMVRETNEEMERRVAEVSSLLEDQQRQHENERAEWQAILKEAEDQLHAVKEGNGVSEHVSTLLEDQQKQHEAERAEWQELLSQAEAQFEALKKKHGTGDPDISDHVSSLMEEQKRQHEQDRANWQEQLNQAEEQLQTAQKENREILEKLESANTQDQHRQDRPLRIAEEKLAQTLAILDEREEQIVQLKNMVKSMSAEVNEHREGVQEVEDEADELRHQNEVLQHRLDTKVTECSELHEELRRLQSEIDRMGNLKMELRLLKEDRERERVKSQSVAENASSNTAKLSTERDAALSEVSSLRQQLAAAQADIEIAQQDAARAQKASENLQMALESIQSEREAELSLLEEQRRSTEESTAAAHAAALEATHEANEARIREVRAEAQEEVLAGKAEIERLEEKLESFRAENVQMRRSLDEAISRLQHNQEDVIDRTLMKNILLDWLTKTGNKEKREILELMASVLHFTDEEKSRVHIGGEVLSLGKVVSTVTAPPPPSKADVEHLQGSNVREKWVNFLLAETDD